MKRHLLLALPLLAAACGAPASDEADSESEGLGRATSPTATPTATFKPPPAPPPPPGPKCPSPTIATTGSTNVTVWGSGPALTLTGRTPGEQLDLVAVGESYIWQDKWTTVTADASGTIVVTPGVPSYPTGAFHYELHRGAQSVACSQSLSVKPFIQISAPLDPSWGKQGGITVYGGTPNGTIEIAMGGVASTATITNLYPRSETYAGYTIRGGGASRVTVTVDGVTAYRDVVVTPVATIAPPYGLPGDTRTIMIHGLEPGTYAQVWMGGQVFGTVGSTNMGDSLYILHVPNWRAQMTEIDLYAIATDTWFTKLSFQILGAY